MKLCIFFIAAMLGSATAETLNQWLAEQVQRDEQLLVDAIVQTGGHSLDMLKDAKTYVPFFLEAPEGAVFVSAKQKEAFAADFEQRLQTAIAPYASSGNPVLEMISLAEYLRQPEAAWRVVDTTGQFNLRNQQQRADEQERLKQVGQLTRTTAVSGLTTSTATTPQTTRPPKPPPVVQPPALKQAPNAKPSPTPSDEATSSTSWSIIVVLIVAGIGLLWFFLKKAKVSRL